MYYIRYILSWIYHNVLYTDATLAIVRILIFIGLVSLLVYREYILFALLCIIVICAEWLIYTDDERNGVTQLFSFDTTMLLNKTSRTVHKDELTMGVPIKEGFSIGIPKIIQGDDSGKDHRRSNTFIEEDSNDFTDKYFNSKQCSIGNEIGGISMFGSNELLEGSTRTVKISGIYDFYGKVTSNDESGNSVKRLNYFNDCVYEPVYRSKKDPKITNSSDFRDIKKKMYQDINNKIINIKSCTSRFNTKILFDTKSDVTTNISKRLSLSDKTRENTQIAGGDGKYDYVSLIIGDKNSDKLNNIRALNKGTVADNASDKTYSELLRSMNTDDYYKNNDALKQKHLNVYSKVYGYRKRIDEILSIIREQTKNDASLLHTIRVSESLVQELRMILAYLTIIEITNYIIVFETEYPVTTNKGIYTGKLATTPPPTTLGVFDTSTATKVATIRGDNDIFNIPLDDDTYNTIDEKRYLYGIAFYFA